MKSISGIPASRVPETSGRSIPFTRYDAGWVVLCIGMAIGSGIVFMPIQMGVKGFWVSITALAIAYPAVYFLSNLYIQSLSASKACEDYADIITQYLGRNWSAVLGIAYFLMLFKGMLAYSSAITRDSASYLQTFGVTHTSLADAPWFALVLIGIMVAIAARGERLLFRISGPMIIVKISVVIILAISMMPQWNVNHLGIHLVPDLLPFVRDVLLTLPFAMFSILYVQILNPMNVAFRRVEPDARVATYRALRASRIAYQILVVCVLFFAFSFLMSVGHEDAVNALQSNISALALAAKVIPGNLIKLLSTVLNVVAIFTAFFGIYLGFHDAVKGLVTNAVDRFMTRSDLFNRALPLFVALFTVFILVAWVVFGISAMALMQVTVPVFGIVSCLIPCYLVYKVQSLQHLKSAKVWFVMVYGVLLVIAPLFKFLEN